jgi:hypothetical protein
LACSKTTSGTDSGKAQRLTQENAQDVGTVSNLARASAKSLRLET